MQTDSTVCFCCLAPVKVHSEVRTHLPTTKLNCQQVELGYFCGARRARLFGFRSVYHYHHSPLFWDLILICFESFWRSCLLLPSLGKSYHFLVSFVFLLYLFLCPQEDTKNMGLRTNTDVDCYGTWWINKTWTYDSSSLRVYLNPWSKKYYFISLVVFVRLICFIWPYIWRYISFFTLRI